MNSKFKLTIGILSYNRPNELSRAIKSLLPLPHDVEVLICDDKSPKLDEILTTISDLLSIQNIKFISNENNLGYDRNLYQVIELASSEYVMLLGDDDYFEEGTVQNVLDYLDLYPDFNCGFVHFRNDDRFPENIKYSRNFASQKYFDSSTLEKDGSFLYTSILFSGLVFSKKSIELNKMDFSRYYKSIYIQIAIFVKLSLKFGTYYINGPGVIIGGDGESGFGFNEASGNIDSDLKDRSSVISNLSYHKRLFSVVKNLQDETKINISTPFNKEYKIRSIKAFYLARQYGRKYLLEYWSELKKVNVKGIWLLYPVYTIIFSLPIIMLNYPILKIEKVLNNYRSKKSKKSSKND